MKELMEPLERAADLSRVAWRKIHMAMEQPMLDLGDRVPSRIARTTDGSHLAADVSLNNKDRTCRRHGSCPDKLPPCHVR